MSNLNHFQHLLYHPLEPVRRRYQVQLRAADLIVQSRLAGDTQGERGERDKEKHGERKSKREGERYRERGKPTATERGSRCVTGCSLADLWLTCAKADAPSPVRAVIAVARCQLGPTCPVRAVIAVAWYRYSKSAQLKRKKCCIGLLICVYVLTYMCQGYATCVLLHDTMINIF